MEGSLSPGQIETLSELGRTLLRSGLPDFFSIYGFDYDRLSALQFDLSLIPSSLRPLLQFTLFSEDIDRANLLAFIPENCLETLKNLGIAEEMEGRVRLVGLRLVYHLGVFVFCQPKMKTAHLYYGEDSLALGRALLGANGTVLDLCAGVGTQGILCAKTSKRVTSVEAEYRCAYLFWVNAALNDVYDKVNLQLSDIRNADLGANSFDYICCNPPLLPVPNEVLYPTVGDGGIDGLLIIKELFPISAKCLSYKGSCRAIGTVLGTEKEPFLDPLSYLAKEYELTARIILIGREPLRKGSRMLHALVSTAAAFNNLPYCDLIQAFSNHYEKQRATHLYSYLIIINNARSSLDKFEVINYVWRHSHFWTV
ncbi:MAG TPA: methyltransferase [Pyrinomonadaceae bacterium]|jgi:methylase of polypeptide subunit release factors